ncbi:hypothetical protein HMPREF1529_03016 [Microbacterium sp. oral taxon 186 str. F0373]|uniref:DUF2510 domain-containing protein n=1 Tax=Microbacterium sp. oral taxon 186 TaxID=712383 RepID=UPI00034E32BD|nr:DUF2510 domain-containing protein [Microbacterium sp. oral taxon 186]EPD83634.1 hypothetical protein HMPREF1529_03016 [Microbacterium sp. oral taxon 186 str. F0373]
MAKNDLNQRILDIAAATEAEAQRAADAGDLAEAKRVLSAGVRDLRDYKRELTEAERSIREQFQDAKLANRQSGQTVGMFMGSKTRAAMARGRAAQGRKLAGNQASALQPYAQAKMNVDRAIATIDRAKADVADEAARLREGKSVPSASTAQEAEVASHPSPPPSAPPPPPPPVPAQWATDPHGRHQHRWWDGARWTEHVSNDGVVTADPI